jgi:hypothetical protein
MTKMKAQLKSISKSLVSLSKQVDRLTKQVDKLQPAKKAAPKRKAAPKAKAKPKRATKTRRVAAKKTPARKKAPARSMTVLDTVFNVIKRSRKGVSISVLKTKTGLDSRQLSNALYKLSKKGMVKTPSRGVYLSK